jgi:WD40 repeat protein
MKTILQITLFVCAPWLLTAQTPAPLFQTGDVSIKALAVSPDGRTVAVVGDGADVGLWDLGTRKKTMNLQRKLQERQSTLLNLNQLLKDEEEVDEEAMEMLSSTSNLNGVFSFGFSLPERAAFNATGTHLTLRHPDGVVVWDIKKAAPQLELFAHPDFYDVSADGQNIVIIEAAQAKEEQIRGADIRGATRINTDKILIYNVVDGKKSAITVTSRSETKRVRFMAGGAKIMVLGVTGDWHTIEVASSAVVHEADVYTCSGEEDMGYVNDATGGIIINSSIALHPSLPLVAATDLENHLMVYDHATRQKKFSLSIPEGLAPGYHFEVLEFTPNGKYLMGIRQNYSTKGVKKTYQFWDVNTGKEQKSINIDVSPWSYYYFTPDGRWMVTSRNDGSKNPPFLITIYDMNTLAATDSFQGRGPFTTFPNDPKRMLFFAGTGVGVYTLKP